MYPLDTYPQFYTNEFIHDMAQSPRWTFSDTNKRPINMYSLITYGHICGVSDKETELLTLEQLVTFEHDLFRQSNGMLSNNALWLNTLVDGYACIDIEPSCDPDIRQELLTIGALYSEVSMSGKGVHLIVPVPPSFHDFPHAITKPAVRDESKGFEILLKHFVTLTRRPTVETISPDINMDLLDEVWVRLASQAKKTIAVDIDFTDEPPADDLLPVSTFLRQHYSFIKTPEDYKNDMSSYEWAMIYFFNSKIDFIYNLDDSPSATFDIRPWTAKERAWIVYYIIREELDHRDKYDTQRDGLPYLLWTALKFLAQFTKPNYDMVQDLVK